jgi:hypothetical protein
MKVDNKTQVAFNQKRNTVRITTKDRFTAGSVWIADMLHVPFGVSLSSSFSGGSRLNKQGRSHSMANRRRVPPPFLRHSVRSFLYRAYTDAIYMFSAPSGLPSGLKPQTGPQAAKSTRLKASTWCTTRKLRCTPSPAAPLSTRCKRVRSSIRPTVLLRQTRTRAASWRIPIQTRTELLLRLLAGACSLPSLRNLESRASSSFLLCMKIAHGLDLLLLCTVSSVWFFSVRPFYDPYSPPNRLAL